MSYPNPLGYWVSVRETHPAHSILKALEDEFGSHFERLSTAELHNILAFCATAKAESVASPLNEFTPNEWTVLNRVAELEDDWQFSLIPFLHEQINSRGRK